MVERTKQHNQTKQTEQPDSKEHTAWTSVWKTLPVS